MTSRAISRANTVSPKKRSGTRSAANSNSRPPDSLAVYLDESLDSESLSSALSAAGVEVIRGSRRFPRGTADEVWLAECGKRGWVVLTRDQRIRYRTLERTALQEAGVRAFVFTGGNVSLASTVARVIEVLPAMRRWPEDVQAPCIFVFGMSGAPRRVD